MPDPMCYEKPRSRGGVLTAAGRTLTLSYFIIYCEDETAALQLARDTTPATYQGMLRKEVTISPLGYGCWDVEVPYELAPIEGITPDVLGFRGGTQSLHINQSRNTMFRRRAADNSAVEVGEMPVEPTAPTAPNPADYPDGEDDPAYIAALAEYDALQAAYEDAFDTYQTDMAAWVAANTAWIGTAPDMKGAIGVDGETVAGCDILVGKIEFFRTTQRLSMNRSYLKKMLSLIGCINSLPFYGFEAGELLYLGAEPTSGRATLPDGSTFNVWTLTHTFAVEFNREDFMIGDIKVPKKLGWQYLWCVYGQKDTAGGITTPPKAVYIEDVYEAKDFGELEIGTDW